MEGKDSDLSIWTRSSENITQRERCTLSESFLKLRKRENVRGKSQIRYRHMETNILPPPCFFVWDHRTEDIKQLRKDLIRDDSTSPAFQHCWKDGCIIVTCRHGIVLCIVWLQSAVREKDEISPTQSIHVLRNSRSRCSPRVYLIN